MASLAGQTGNAGQFNYSASKGALIAMTKSLAMEVGSRGVRVNAIAPGLIETEMISSIPHLDEFKKRIPLGRFGTLEEVAGTVSFLCSADAGYITGATISVNGGLFPHDEFGCPDYRLRDFGTHFGSFARAKSKK